MESQREPEYIIEELHDLSQLIADTKRLSIAHPDDKLLALALQQDKHRRELLLKELYASLQRYLHSVA